MKKILVVTSMAVVMAMGSLSAAQAKSCKAKKVYETGPAAVTWAGARVRAKAEWRIEAVARYGLKYGAWALAKSKSINCWKAGLAKKCKVAARPCRL